MTSPEPPFSPLRPRDPRSVGDYRTVGRLGAGGMGAVYAAKDASGALVAVKLVHGDLAADPEFRVRFHREADLVRRVVSPCVPRFLASDTGAEQPWLATEYVAGPTLSQHVREHGPLTGPGLRAFAVGIAEALRAIHAAGIVHRDLKPGNVVLAPDGPKVLDFGIARALDETAITRTGGLFGTPGWVAPELLRGGPPTPAADMFAWGGLVAFAATGRSPYGKGSAETVAVRVLDGHPDLDGVPEDLMPLVTAATGSDPGLRPTVDQVLARLLGRSAPDSQDEATALVTQVLREGWKAPPTPTAVAGTRVPAPVRPPVSRRKRLMVGSVAVLSLAAVAGLGWMWGSGVGGRGPGPEAASETVDGTRASEAGNEDGSSNGREIATEVVGDGLFTVYAAEPGELGITQGFDGVGSVLTEDAERAEYAIATVRLNTVYADTAAQRGIKVFGEVEYVADSGEFTLHTEDLVLWEVGDGLDPLPDDPAGDGRPAHVADTDEILATVTPDTPSAEFEVVFPQAPESGLLGYLPAPTAHGEDVDRVRGSYVCYMNWHPLPPVDMADEQYVPCPEEPPA